ncbi:Metallo-hydrolase/oxidoreductase [Eremomyces bilateralis CBS 781.70]|uniref:Metallo-hydrolase/oxidoreductase n=1 Tax=Eremomyces bilateralis CBS 781.70 TaxID=1392243 RepID=A0A6G1G449_9PEZI|nr:Metallo-hydrolase/oxidoreductase [Eremomyces bilateralis CBS 781.70]KAF1812867.1 Metallo-hydrolase/oxidoreductase [Eremomyces bilateralis CBS 781.70]
MTSAILYSATISPAKITGAVPEDAPELEHHLKGKKGFRNPWTSWKDITFWGALKLIFTGGIPNPDTTQCTIPVRKPQFPTTRETSTLRATWLGHASFYVEFPSGFRALFDPVFEPRCSPVSFLGPKRYTPPPVEVEDIPIIDAVIISHNHYDHLSLPTLTKIKELHPNVQFFAPLGNKEWFVSCGFHNITELDWWESRDVKLSSTAKPAVAKVGHDLAGDQGQNGIVPDIEATIGCLPCQHISSRTPFDRGHTLWGSWSVESGGKKLWFGGDTGYRGVPSLPPSEDDYGPEHDYPHCPAFKSIGELRGPFDLGLIPIGAYEPRHFMSPMHANPYDSVNIFIDTQCKKALGMHWGTWVLTGEEVMQPPEVLKKAMAWKGLPETGVFDVCDLGETREFEEEQSVAKL